MELDDAAGSNWEPGVQALREGRVDDAIAQLQAFVEANPDSFEGNNFLGVALAQAKRAPEAVGFLQRATQLHPRSAQAHYNFGLALLGNQQLEQARSEFQAALKIEPEYSQAHQALLRIPQPDVPANEKSFPAEDQSAADAITTEAETAAPTMATGNAAFAPSGINPPSDINPPMSETYSESLPVPQLNAATSSPLTAVDVIKAWLFGSVAAIIGAIIWDKITYYTNYQIGLVAVGVGILVGVAVSRGAGGKSGTALKVMGALLSGIGILLGQALIIMDTARGMSSAGLDALNASPILLFIISVALVPKVLIADPLSLLFVAIGVWQGWQIAGAADSASSANPETIPAGNDTTNNADTAAATVTESPVNTTTPPSTPVSN